MPSSRLALSQYLEAATTAAHAGAAILQSYAHHRRADLVIDRKALNDLVSQADREAEQAIVEHLRQAAPELGIVAEETGGSQSGKATWYIDPLDGTTNFLHGIPHYAVSIGLIAHPGAIVAGDQPLAQDTPVLGIVYDPCREEMFTAMYGVGAWLNGHRIACANAATLADAVLGTGLPFRDFSFTDQYMPMLEHAIHHSRGVRRLGAASLDLAWVACGRFDGYWEMGLAPWDVAGGTVLVREAGGIVQDMHQQEPWPSRGNLYAGNPGIAQALEDMVRPHLRHLPD